MIVFDKTNGRAIGVDVLEFLNTNSNGSIVGISKSTLTPKFIMNESEDDELVKHITKELQEGKSFEEIYTGLNEGLFGQIVGGLSGFALGNKVGEIICRVLGIGEGILKDLLTSRLFGAAMGAAIGKKL